LQFTEDAKLRLEVNMQALRAQFERDLQVMQSTLFVGVNFRLYINANGWNVHHFDSAVAVRRGHAVAQLVEALRYKPEV
jgi:hypothetical protein